VRRECNSCKEIKGKIGQRWVLFIVSLLGLVFSLSLTVYSAIQLETEVRRGYSNAPIGERIVVVASLGLNLLLLVFFSYTLSKYLLQRRATVKLVFQ
jgi:TRAP-type C4-dicarboxylate transport system permease small subunit